jgi:hypothetical protein
MADLLFIALILGFFGVAVLLVAACDRIIGPDPDLVAPPDADELAVLAEKEFEVAQP